MHEIYLAGGCFWGVGNISHAFPGVTDAVSGYANGRGETTKYELINQTGHAETVHVTYDAKQISLKEIPASLLPALSIQPAKINKEMMWEPSTVLVFITQMTRI